MTAPTREQVETLLALEAKATPLDMMLAGRHSVIALIVTAPNFDHYVAARNLIRPLAEAYLDGLDAAERARLSAGVEMTDAEIGTLWEMHFNEEHRSLDEIGFARALMAEASARATAAERERCARWHEDKARICHAAWIDAGATRYLDVREAHLVSAAAHRAGEE